MEIINYCIQIQTSHISDKEETNLLYYNKVQVKVILTFSIKLSDGSLSTDNYCMLCYVTSYFFGK